MVIPHESVHAGSFVFEISDYASDICVLGYHFTGITGSGLPVEADLYYELRPDPAETQTVTDGDFVSFLNQLVSEGLVADPSRVTTQELFQLQQSGKIRRLGEGWEIVTP